MLTRLAAVAGILLAGSSLSCRSDSPGLEVWIIGTPESPPNRFRTGGPLTESSLSRRAPARPRIVGMPSADRGPARVKIAGALNETVSFRFAIRPGTTAMPEPGLRVKPLKSVNSWIDASVVELYRMQGVSLDRLPGWHIRSIAPSRRNLRPLDALVPVRAPRAGLPSELTAGVNYHFWVDVSIPKGTFEGVYSTRIEVLSEGSPVGAVDVELTVWPMMLPDSAGLAAIVELDHRALFRHHIGALPHGIPTAIDDWRDHPRRSEIDALLQSTMRTLQAHRLTPVLPHLEPTVKVDTSGGLLIDWAQYDDVVSPLMTGRAFFNRVPLPFWPLPTGSLYAPRHSSGRVSALQPPPMMRQYLAQCIAHFEEKGWSDRGYAAIPQQAARGIDDAEATRQLGEMVHAEGGRVSVASRLFPQDMRPYGWIDYSHTELTDSVDIWMPPAQYYDPEAMAAQRAAGRRSWLTVDRPPFSGSTAVFAPSSYLRILSWQALELGAEALFVGEVNQWPTGELSADPQACIDTDPNVLLYPGRVFGLDEPIASVRLKQLRRAMADAAYVRLLNEHGLEHVATALRESLVTYVGTEAYRTHFADGRSIGWIDDPELFDTARRIMAQEMIRSLKGDRPEAAGQEFSRTATWGRLMSSARRLYLRVDGTRIRTTGTPATPMADIDCSISLLNRKRSPVGGRLRFGELPEDWAAGPDRERIPPLSPGEARRLTRSASANLLPVAMAGVFTLPIEFAADDGSTHNAMARVSALTAIPIDGPIKIDGDLSDWPPGIANVASDFRLIAGPTADDMDGSSAEPAARTLGFVMRDDEHLFVAINCEAEAGTSEAKSSHKGVRYDDMIPVGEELVELLIDPLNLGTRSPGDLYHIVVKRSGTDLTEKGIAFDPPCGPREVWPVDIDVATQVQPQRWTAELRIPLQAVGPPPHRNVIWGFNIARYDQTHQELSTWSGALHNAYDPISLGNLYLP